MHSKLLSMSKLISRGLKVHFNLLECMVKANNGNMLGFALLESNLYQLDTNVMNGAKTSFLARSDGNSHSLELWHKRLGRFNKNNMIMLQGMVSKMDVGAAQADAHTCEKCVEGKQTRRLLSTDGGIRATNIQELVYSNVCGSMKTLSIGGAWYFLIFIDDFLRKIWMYVLKSKSEVLVRFKK